MRLPILIAVLLLQVAQPVWAEDDATAFLKQLGASTISKVSKDVVVKFADGTVVVISGHHITTISNDGVRFITDGDSRRLAVKPAGQPIVSYEGPEPTTLIGSGTSSTK
jgi:hypothetical protein